MQCSMSETDSSFPNTPDNLGSKESYKLEERKMASPESPENLQEPLFPQGEAEVPLEVLDPRRMRERDFSARASVWHQFRALFLKDLTLQSRAIGTNLCQLLTPIIFICFAGIMQVIVNHILSSHQTAIPGSDAYLIPVDAGRVIACLPENNSYNNPAVCRDEFLNFFDEFDWEKYLEEIANISNSTDVEEFVQEVWNLSRYSIIPQQQILFDLPFYYVGKAEDVELPLGNLSFNGTRNGFLGQMVPGEWYYNFSMNFTVDPDWPLNRSFPDDYTNDEGPYLSIPFFLEIEDRSTLNQRLVDVIKDYNHFAHSSSAGEDQYDRTYVVTPLSQDQYLEVLWDVRNGTQEQNETFFYKVRPHGGIFIEHYGDRNETVDVEYTMVADELALYDFLDPDSQGQPTPNEVHRRNNIINMMSNALFKELTNLSDTANVAIATYIMPLPSASMNITIDLSTLLGAILYPFAASFLIPVFMSSVVKDHHEKHLIMMEQNGLNRWTYWVVTYLFHYLLYIIVVIPIFVFSYIFQFRLFTQTDFLVLFLVFFLWGHAEVVLGFFFSNFFSRPRTATIVGYLIVIAGVLIALLLEGLQIFPSDSTPFPIYMMYPPFAFYRILFYLNFACLSLRCYHIDVLSSTDGLNLVTTGMLYLGGITFVLIIISVYLSYVLPGEYGVRKSPFFPLIAIFKFVRYLLQKAGLCGERKCLKNRELTRSPPHRSVSIEVEEEEEEEDEEDVHAEEEALGAGFPDNVPMVMFQLRKEYPGSGSSPPHVAVHSISLAIQRNECFGLLGPNGAGKTTLISVLTGLYEPTSGTARIAGYDIATEINEIHHHLGVCPQFDIQHADLTAEEHLLFYARLKGVRWRREKAVVQRALRQVNLYEARKKKSKALSGGMRRRLSVAMACIGSPDILILDEPTTGLDPASRRQVWEVIETVKQGRSVILTTHAMEEADHLCTRIGIMNFGRLRCLGTQTRLKAKFGSGYQLQFHCAPGRVGEVEGFVQMHLPRAVHMETYADSCSYQMEKEDLCVSELFQLFDSARDQVGILDWGIKMTTLEDVFLNIVKQSRDTRTHLARSYCPNWLPCPCYRRTKTTTEE